MLTRIIQRSSIVKKSWITERFSSLINHKDWNTLTTIFNNKSIYLFSNKASPHDDHCLSELFWTWLSSKSFIWIIFTVQKSSKILTSHFEAQHIYFLTDLNDDASVGRGRSKITLIVLITFGDERLKSETGIRKNSRVHIIEFNWPILIYECGL